MGNIIKGILALAVLCSSARALLYPLQRHFHGAPLTRGKTTSVFRPSGCPLAYPVKVNDEPTILEIVSILEGQPAVIVLGETIYDVLPGRCSLTKQWFDQCIWVYTKKPNNIVAKLQSVYSSTSFAVAEWLHRRQVMIIRTDDVRTKKGMYPRIDLQPKYVNTFIALAICFPLAICGVQWSISLIDSGSYLIGWSVYILSLFEMQFPLFFPLDDYFSIIMPNYNSMDPRSDSADRPDSAYAVSNWYCTIQKVATSASIKVVIPSISYDLEEEDGVDHDPETSLEQLIQQKRKEDLVQFDNELNNDRII